MTDDIQRPSSGLVRKRPVTLLAITVACLAVPPTSAQQQHTGSGKLPVGVNLDFVLDYAPETPFRDLYKTARPWISQHSDSEWGEGPPLDLTEDGQWVRSLKPGQFATTLIACTKNLRRDRYLCTYQGRGELRFEGDVTILEHAPGRLLIEIRPPGEILLHLRSTDSDDYVRDIAIWPEEDAKAGRTIPFRNEFFFDNALYSVVRFKDWQKIDHSPIVTWDDRPVLSQASQAHNGVALGWIIELSNQMQVDPWVCIPHRANDDYVRNFARQLASDLQPERRVYVEYTNEIWNTIFSQHPYAADRGGLLQLPGDDYARAIRFYARRCKQVFQIIRAEFPNPDRVICAVGGQADNPWVAEQMLDFEGLGESADALAIAPYFGHEFGTPENAENVARLTVDDAIKACRDDLPRLKRDTFENARIAQKYDLPLIAYEGGQHLWALHEATENKRFVDLIIRANRDPRMEQLYIDHLTDWKAAGGSLYVTYKSAGKPGKFGSWGLREYERQPLSHAPKLRGLLRFYEQTPQWW